MLLIVPGLLVLATALVASARPGHVLRSAFAHAAAPFADSTDVYADSVVAESIPADSIVADPRPADSLDAATADSLASSDTLSFWRSHYYFPSGRRDRYTASPLARRTRPFSPRLGSYWRHEISMDSTGSQYVARETVGAYDVRFPVHMDLDTYRRLRLREDMHESWLTLSQRQAQRARGTNNPFGFNIVIPGGRESAFSTIFGKNEVDLRVSGQADINAGFDYRKSEQQASAFGQAGKVDPLFKQDLRLGIQGTIGDKLNVDVSWDTQSQFDYQNQLRLRYQGYEDEIIQRIEAGNVMLQTPSTLIRGGQSLFGIKSELQLGGVKLTTVASQQEGQSSNLSISGGSETVDFDVRPTDYDDATHFFLGYYFRNRWNQALANPPNITVSHGFEGITDIEVWRILPRRPEDEDVRQAVAVVDLGESSEILTLANAYTDQLLPDQRLDQYSEEEIESQLRFSTQVGDYLASKGLSPSDYQVGWFKKLIRGRDYDLNPALGYISLNSRLQDQEALAVGYKLVASGQVLQVGDFSTETGGSSGGQRDQKLVLKLLRPVSLNQPRLETGFNPAAWYFEMRNIYRLRPGLNANDFDLQIYYEPPGRTPTKSVQDIGGTQTLLQLLGLDRLNVDGAPRPDDRFDFLPNFTIIPGKGLLIFPYLEPFGRRVEELVEQGGGDVDQARNLYVFDNLYTVKREEARRDTQKDVFRIRGASRGAVQDFYDIGGYAGLIEGSVRVTSGGRPLQEGADYIVDYAGGSVRITNQAYLTSGRDINITWEQNQFIALQKKTLIGMRADYGEREDPLKLGATMMRLHQKSPIDKFRLGEEPVSNMIWGVDGRFDLQPRWLTRAVDFLPLIQTKEPSRIEISGEFAQLRPGHVETLAFQRTRRDLRGRGLDFADDELRGVSYLDDFEGFENTYSLKQPGGWVLSAPPDSIGAVDPLPGDPLVHSSARYDSLRTNWRASLGWYSISSQLWVELGRPNIPAIMPVPIHAVYPNRDIRAETGDRNLQTLDLFFSPRERGPYNYTRDLAGFFLNPANAWGGMTQPIPQGYTDFNERNIEFVEFVFRPFAESEDGDAGPGAMLYVDLGEISEDIIPNLELNSEDGLSLSSVSAGDLDAWSRLPRGTPDGVIAMNKESRRTNDLGLDGLVSYDESAYPEQMRESYVFRDFLNALDPNAVNDPFYRAEVEKARFDPSGDLYFFFTNTTFFGRDDFFPGGVRPQQRFSRFFPGTELNSYEAQREFGEGRGNSRYPDSEDLNRNGTIDTRNNYFQYGVPLSLRRLTEDADRPGIGNGDFVVTEITDATDGSRTGWFQVRIPVRDFTRRVGDPHLGQIQSIRIWTTGNEVPVTIRFAELELVGSQWRKSARVATEDGEFLDADSSAVITISSINNEANSREYLVPDGAVVSQLRLPTGGTQAAREQAMVLRVQDLRPGQQRAVYKTFQGQGLDLLKYEFVRMFVHMHGRTADGVDLTTIDKAEAREKARLFIRFGANESNDYYEYEQPLTPSRTREVGAGPDEIWQMRQPWGDQIIDLNAVNVRLGALNQLKFERDTRGFVPDSVFWNEIRTPEGMVRQGPDISGSSPPGSRVGIKGNPSLARVNAIVIGIRNGHEDEILYNAGDILEDVTVWVNELRVSGYDETNGWAGVMHADVKLADLARVRANVSAQTDGFGSLSSTLGEREQNNIRNWGFTSEFFADKFIPERYGWSLPVNLQYQSNSSTPRFSPGRGDIRLDEILAQIDERPDLDEAERARLKAEEIESAQTLNVTRSITARVSKRGSRSKFLRNTLDNVALSYSYSDQAASSPTLQMNDSWRWSSSAGYSFRMRPRTVRPLWFIGEIPILGFLGDVRFNYAPQNIGFNASANRSFTESQERPRIAAADTLPAMVQYPMREGQVFGHRRTFDFQYNPFTFLNLSFNTATTQNLNAVGVDTLFTMVIRDPTSGLYAFHPGLSAQAAIDQGLIEQVDLNRRAFEVRQLNAQPTDRVLSRIFSGDGSPRTEQYQQGFQATFQPRFTRHKKLNWLTISPISYNATFTWSNGPVGRFTGASVSNRAELRGGLNLRPQEFWRNFGFYRALEEQQRQADAEKRRITQERDAERERRRVDDRRRRDEEHRRREAERAAAAEPAAADTTGAPPAEVPPPPEITPPPDAEDRERVADSDAEDEDSGRGFRLPLPDPIPLLRRTVLAVTGMRDLSINYTNTTRGTSSNVADYGVHKSSYSLLDALKGDGPSVGYRFGLSNTIPTYKRVLDPSLQVSDAINVDHRIQGRTMLNPSQNLQITLNWDTNWGMNENITFRSMTDFTQTEGGTASSSVWAFGASYQELFARQFDTYLSDEARALDKASFGDADGDGRVVLTNHSVTEDFQSTFLKGFGMFDSRGLLPFPMPSWNVNYTGISRWPIIRRLVESATLKHGYSARYSTDYRTNIAGVSGDSLQFDLAGRRITYRIPEFDVGAIRVSEQYTPFIGVSLAWKSRIQSDISWNKNNSYSMSTSNFELGHSKTNQIDLTASYFRQGMRLPFFGRVQNRISFSLTVGYSETSDVRYPLRTALRGAITDPEFTMDQLRTNDDYVSILSQIKRYSATPRIAYQFSQKLQTDFSVRYERLIGDSRQPSFSSVSGQFNVRVSIAN